MGSEQSELSKESETNKKKDSSIKIDNFGFKNQEIEENQIIHILYSLDYNLLVKDYLNSIQYISLFGRKFVEANKNKCKIIVAGKEYKIIHEIKVIEFKDYGINKNCGMLEVILKGK